MALLEHLYERHALTLKKGLPYDEYLQEVGVLRAYEEMATYADQVVLKLEEVHDRTSRKSGAAQPDARSLLAFTHWAAPSGV